MSTTKKQITGKRTKKTISSAEQPQDDVVQGDCTVCCSPYTSVKRKPVKCLYCDYEVCVECLQQYLLSKADSHCMNCKKVWTTEFLKKHFSKTFVNDKLQDHYIDVLMELETSLFPETLTFIEQRDVEIKAQHLNRDLNHIVSYQILLTSFHEYLSDPKRTATFENELGMYLYIFFESWPFDNDLIITNLDDEVLLHPSIDETTKAMIKALYYFTEFENITVNYINIFTKTLQQFKQILKSFHKNTTYKTFKFCALNHFTHLVKRVLDQIAKILNCDLATNNESVQASKNKTRTRCTTENCIGYFLPLKNSVGQCKVCKNISCTECLSKLEADTDKHECDPATVETIKLIQKSTVMCPKCKTSVSKIAGCDQMFCTACNTPFDWKTGQVITGRIHNPHYFEYLKNRKTSDQTMNVGACNETVLPDDLYVLLDKAFSVTFSNQSTTRSLRKFWYFIINMHRNRIVSRDTRFSISIPPTERYRFLRIDFLSGQISKDEWKSRLKTEHREFNLNNEIYQLENAACLLAHDILTNLFNGLNEIIKMVFPEGISAETNQDFYCSLMNSYELHKCKANALVQNAYDCIIDLIAYYNQNLRIIEQNYNHTTYKKIVIPNSKSNEFKEKTVKITDNELDIDISNLSINDEQLVNSMLKEEKEVHDLCNFFEEKIKAITKIMKKCTKRGMTWIESIVLAKDNSSLETVIELANEVNNARILQELQKKFEIYKVLIKKGKLRNQIIQKLNKKFFVLTRNFAEKLHEVTSAANIDSTVEYICANSTLQTKVLKIFDEKFSSVQKSTFFNKFLALEDKWYEKKELLALPRDKLLKAFLISNVENYNIPLHSCTEYNVTIDFFGLKLTIPSIFRGLVELIEYNKTIQALHHFSMQTFTAKVNDQNISYIELLLIPYLFKGNLTIDDVSIIRSIIHDYLYDYCSYDKNINNNFEHNLQNFNMIPIIKQQFCSSLIKYMSALDKSVKDKNKYAPLIQEHHKKYMEKYNVLEADYTFNKFIMYEHMNLSSCYTVLDKLVNELLKN